MQVCGFSVNAGIKFPSKEVRLAVRRQPKWDKSRRSIREELPGVVPCIDRDCQVLFLPGKKGSPLDLLSPFHDPLTASEIDIGGSEVLQRFMVAFVVIVVNEIGNRLLQIPWQAA